MRERASEILTVRLRLRRARLDDLDAIHAIMTDEETMRFWSTPPHTSLDQTRVWLESMVSADPALSDEFVIEHGGEAIGKLGAWRLPEIGFFIRRDHWGAGFAREALDAFAAYIGDRGVDRLTADVDPLNFACLRLLASAGFEKTGEAKATYVVGERVCDSVYLARDLTTIAPPAVSDSTRRAPPLAP